MSTQSPSIAAPSDAAPSSPLGAETRQATAREKEVKARLLEYFSERLDVRIAEHRLLQHSITVMKVIMFLCGIGLVLMPFANAPVSEPFGWQQLLEDVNLRFLLPGVALILIALIKTLWTKNWYFPLALALLASAVAFHLFDTSHLTVIIALGAIGLLMLAWGLWDWWIGRKGPKELEATEKEFDALIKERFDGLVETVRCDLPIDANRLAGMTFLKSFPDRDRIGGAVPLARIGTDKKPRISPVGFAAFDFSQGDVLLFEGAIDLVNNTIVYAAVHEFRYGDIVAMSWSSEMSPSGQTAKSKKMKLPVRSGGVRAYRKSEGVAAIRCDEFVIRLCNGQSLSIAFKDKMFHTRLLDPKCGQIEDLQEIRKVWKQLSAGKRSARAGEVNVA